MSFVTEFVFGIVSNSYDLAIVSPRLKCGASDLKGFCPAKPFSCNIPKASLDLVISLGSGDIEIAFPGHGQKGYEI